MEQKPISNTNVVSIRVPRAIYLDIVQESQQQKTKLSSVICRRLAEGGNERALSAQMQNQHKEIQNQLKEMKKSITEKLDSMSYE